MKEDFLKHTSGRQVLYSTVLFSSLMLGSPQFINATTENVRTVMQSGIVKGTVIDVNGEPIIGANVMVKGTTNGTITDVDGNFSLDNAKGVLVISYIGYNSQEIAVEGNETNLKIVLKEDSKQLEEVVVVGYGTQKKETLTGAVAMVKGDEVLKGRAASNVGTALQGAIPGLTVTRSSSRPTENATISIRGGISANSSDPLILIDGVDAYAWELNQLNPNDIESVSVLKDAAASIYGARAAGGVILITTKRAKEGKTTVSYNGSVTANFVGKDYPAATGSEWARMMLMADQNDTNHPNGASSLWTLQGWNVDFYERVMNNEAFDWEGTNTLRIDPLNANQVDLVYGTTWGTSHNLSIQSGSENLKSMTSVGYSNDRSLIKVVYDGQKKYNFRNNTDYNIGKYVKLETGLSYDYKQADVPTYGIGYGLQDMWIFPLYTESGTHYYDNFGGNNVIAHLTEGGKTVTSMYMLRASGKMTIDLSFINEKLKGLSFYAKGSIRQYNENKKAQSHKIQMYTYYDVADGPQTTNGATTGSKANKESLTEGNTRALYQLYEYFLNYDRTFGKHHVSAMFGNTNELRDNYVTEVYRSSSTPVTLNDLNLYDTTTDKISKSESYKWSYVSLVGRVNYDFAGKYLIVTILFSALTHIAT